MRSDMDLQHQHLYYLTLGLDFLTETVKSKKVTDSNTLSTLLNHLNERLVRSISKTDPRSPFELFTNLSLENPEHVLAYQELLKFIDHAIELTQFHQQRRQKNIPREWAQLEEFLTEMRTTLQQECKNLPSTNSGAHFWEPLIKYVAPRWWLERSLKASGAKFTEAFQAMVRHRPSVSALKPIQLIDTTSIAKISKILGSEHEAITTQISSRETPYTEFVTMHNKFFFGNYFLSEEEPEVKNYEETRNALKEAKNKSLAGIRRDMNAHQRAWMEIGRKITLRAERLQAIAQSPEAATLEWQRNAHLAPRSSRALEALAISLAQPLSELERTTAAPVQSENGGVFGFLMKFFKQVKTKIAGEPHPVLPFPVRCQNAYAEALPATIKAQKKAVFDAMLVRLKAGTTAGTLIQDDALCYFAEKFQLRFKDPLEPTQTMTRERFNQFCAFITACEFPEIRADFHYWMIESQRAFDNNYLPMVVVRTQTGDAILCPKKISEEKNTSVLSVFAAPWAILTVSMALAQHERAVRESNSGSSPLMMRIQALQVSTAKVLQTLQEEKETYGLKQWSLLLETVSNTLTQELLVNVIPQLLNHCQSSNDYSGLWELLVKAEKGDQSLSTHTRQLMQQKWAACILHQLEVLEGSQGEEREALSQALLWFSATSASREALQLTRLSQILQTQDESIRGLSADEAIDAIQGGLGQLASLAQSPESVSNYSHGIVEKFILPYVEKETSTAFKVLWACHPMKAEVWLDQNGQIAERYRNYYVSLINHRQHLPYKETTAADQIAQDFFVLKAIKNSRNYLQDIEHALSRYIDDLKDDSPDYLPVLLTLENTVLLQRYYQQRLTLFFKKGNYVGLLLELKRQHQQSPELNELIKNFMQTLSEAYLATYTGTDAVYLDILLYLEDSGYLNPYCHRRFSFLLQEPNGSFRDLSALSETAFHEILAEIDKIYEAPFAQRKIQVLERYVQAILDDKQRPWHPYSFRLIQRVGTPAMEWEYRLRWLEQLLEGNQDNARLLAVEPCPLTLAALEEHANSSDCAMTLQRLFQDYLTKRFKHLYHCTQEDQVILARVNDFLQKVSCLKVDESLQLRHQKLIQMLEDVTQARDEFSHEGKSLLEELALYLNQITNNASQGAALMQSGLLHVQVILDALTQIGLSGLTPREHTQLEALLQQFLEKFSHEFYQQTPHKTFIQTKIPEIERLLRTAVDGNPIFAKDILNTHFTLFAVKVYVKQLLKIQLLKKPPDDCPAETVLEMYLTRVFNAGYSDELLNAILDFLKHSDFLLHILPWRGQELGAKKGIPYCCSTVGNDYFEQGKEARAKECFIQAQQCFIQAKEWFIQADDDLVAHYYLGKIYKKEAESQLQQNPMCSVASPDYSEAKKHFKLAAAGDDWQAQYALGKLYRKEGQYLKALGWFHQSAKTQGIIANKARKPLSDPQFHYDVAQKYAERSGSVNDTQAAQHHYEEAVRLGHPRAAQELQQLKKGASFFSQLKKTLFPSEQQPSLSGSTVPNSSLS